MGGSSTGPGTASLAGRVLRGDRRALARLITLIENERPEVAEALPELHRRAGSARIIGVTGAPGTGKSTLVNALAREYRRRGYSVGIVAVDPSSVFTGGAILGDRVRMQELAGDAGVFIRSMASRGALGGLAAATQEVVTALDAAGFDRILVETVGVGQAEINIARAADTTVVVGMPGTGDDIQAIKAGILEIGDVFVINKADLGAADQLAKQLQLALPMPPEEGWLPPILQTIATEGSGIAELVTALESHGDWLARTGSLEERRRARFAAQIGALVQRGVLRRLGARGDSATDGLLDAVARRELDPHAAAARLLARDQPADAVEASGAP